MLRPADDRDAPPTTPGRKVVPRTRGVIAVDHDPERPGKPLKLLVPGGLLAVGSFLAMLFVGYRAWYQQEMDTTLAVWLLVLLGVVWFESYVFLFSYGYTLYDTKKALKMTLLIGIVGVLVVAIAIALFVVFRDDSVGAEEAAAGEASSSSSSEGGGLDRLDDRRPDIFPSPRRSGGAPLGCRRTRATSGRAARPGRGAVPGVRGEPAARGARPVPDARDGPARRLASPGPGPLDVPGDASRTAPRVSRTAPGRAGAPRTRCVSRWPWMSRSKSSRYASSRRGSWPKVGFVPMLIAATAVEPSSSTARPA